MHYDDLLKHLGEAGRFQKVMYLSLFFMLFPSSIHINNVIFLTEDPVFRCAVPGLDNDTYHIQDEVHRHLVNVSIPYDSHKGHYSQCTAYDQFRTNRTVSCDRWVYDSTKARNSMIPDLDIVCDEGTYKVKFGLVLMLGLLVGSTFGGITSDYFGRKTVLVVTVTLHFIINVAFTFVTSLSVALFVKFLQAAIAVAGHMAKFVLIVELIGPRYRGVAALSVMLAWSIPMCLIALVYYLCQDWKIAELVLTLPLSVCIIGSCMLPESPRWLLVNNKVPQAKRIISRIARTNGVVIPDGMVESLHIVNVDKKQSAKRRQMIFKIFKDKTMVLRLAILGLNWGIINIAYYGLTLNMGSLAGKNIYLAMMTQGVVETIAYGCCAVSSGWLNRKFSYCISTFLGGYSCLLAFFLGLGGVDDRRVNLVFFAIGKFGIGAGFTLVYTLTAELIPTTSRNFGLGFCSMCGRIMGILAPYIADLRLLIPGKVGEVSPLVVFGVISLIAGISIYLLPETSNSYLPEMVIDVKKGEEDVTSQEENMV